MAIWKDNTAPRLTPTPTEPRETPRYDPPPATAKPELAASPAVRRYETSFVKKEIKNRPMVRLDERDA